ncbi:uncharacterized protein (AIM24 family) [Prauserella shujinwangii]|uniref:Uncharacterized protein (AIM24 family) n=1 Tax=Prauserella shujinwangii TaxID=1453103 RepID=A0A2T0M166_9PSEU|nr:AIM24 family protein [Prauserella shujinwangii]PRX50290.1 uncharacterized protein (AIM24 family) [Prauserella shujinwangii]
MRVSTRHTPAFGVARLLLSAGEAVEADARAMVASSFGVVETRAGRRGGRTGSVFTAPQTGGWIDLAPDDAGDVHPVELDGRVGWSVARAAVLARPATVRRDHPWPAHQALFGSDAGFLEHYSGTGPLVLAARGPVDAFALEAGEVITVSPAYVLGYPDPVQCRLRAVDPAGPQSVRTGEGLALDFAGPGTVLLQTRARR